MWHLWTTAGCPLWHHHLCALVSGSLLDPSLYPISWGEYSIRGPRWLVDATFAPDPPSLSLPRCLCFQAAPHPQAFVYLNWSDATWQSLPSWAFWFFFFLFPLWGCQEFLVSIFGLSCPLFPWTGSVISPGVQFLDVMWIADGFFRNKEGPIETAPCLSRQKFQT